MSRAQQIPHQPNFLTSLFPFYSHSKLKGVLQHIHHLLRPKAQNTLQQLSQKEHLRIFIRLGVRVNPLVSLPCISQHALLSSILPCTTGTGWAKSAEQASLLHPTETPRKHPHQPYPRSSMKIELKWLNRYTFTSVTHKLNKLSFKTPTEHSLKMLGPRTSINS